MDLDEAYNAVVDRLERTRAELPEDADQSGVYRFNSDDEIVMEIHDLAIGENNTKVLEIKYTR